MEKADANIVSDLEKPKNVDVVVISRHKWLYGWSSPQARNEIG